MRLFVDKKRIGEIEYGIIYGVITLTALIAARCLPVLDLMPACLFRSVTGLPCPTCGSTRSLIHIAGGDLSGAFLYNPLFASLLLASLGTMTLHIALIALGRRKIRLHLNRSEGTALRYLAVLLFAANWCYLVFHL